MLRWDNLEGKTILDRYEITSELGAGGAGMVYTAYDKVEDRQVAIKTSNPHSTMSNFKERFRMEAKALSKLDHPNIIQFYDHTKVEDFEIIVMEYVEGISLENKIKKEKSLPVKEATKYIRQLLSALEAVHAAKIYHRDVKPDNIHITVDGTLKLLDFGIVQETVDQDLTRQGSIIGTVSYLAPELVTDPSKKSNPRTDIYSVGVMFFQLLAGVKPFEADAGIIGHQQKSNNIGRKIAFEKPLKVNEIDPSISDGLTHFIDILLEKDPADRYQTAKEAIVELDKVSKGAGMGDLKGFYEEETEEYSMKKQIIMASAGAMVLIGLIVVLILIFTL